MSASSSMALLEDLVRAVEADSEGGARAMGLGMMREMRSWLVDAEQRGRTG